MGVRRIFMRKSSSEVPQMQRWHTPFVQAPSALQYPGVMAEPVSEPAPEPAPKKDAKDGGAGLPRCPKCGWSVGYTDRTCSNCEQAIQPKR